FSNNKKKTSKMNKFISAILILSMTAVLADFPASVKRCGHGDEACFTQSSQEVFKAHYGGLKELNLVPFDPLHINSLSIDRNPSSPVNLELKFKDFDLLGLRSTQVRYLRGLEFNGRSELEALIPQLILKGNYQVDGRVLILPIVGNGDCEIICKNIVFKYSFDMKQVEKNGQIYAELQHVKLNLKPELVQFQFKNLFNGDKALGDNMNKFMNDNWSDIFQELEPAFTKALSLIVKQVINNVLSKYPHESLFT
ncbi:hypothetical protein DOY81_004732, partial [Sarcophaga bullata]